MYAAYLVEEAYGDNDSDIDDFSTWGEIVDYYGDDIDLPKYPTFGDEPKFTFVDGDLTLTIYYVEAEDQEDIDDRLGELAFILSDLDVN